MLVTLRMATRAACRSASAFCRSVAICDTADEMLAGLPKLMFWNVVTAACTWLRAATRSCCAVAYACCIAGMAFCALVMLPTGLRNCASTIG